MSTQKKLALVNIFFLIALWVLSLVNMAEGNTITYVFCFAAGMFQVYLLFDKVTP